MESTRGAVRQPLEQHLQRAVRCGAARCGAVRCGAVRLSGAVAHLHDARVEQGVRRERVHRQARQHLQRCAGLLEAEVRRGLGGTQHREHRR
eukprot:scaffold47398_cov63-Phaeocystis_antarctica.AAC.3